jgi:hypothetical protein
VQRDGEDEDNIPVEQDEVETPLPNLMELMYYFEQAGVGLGREEMFRVWLSLKQLVDRYPLDTVRFWGKIFGTEQNYYIAEVKFQEGKDDLEDPEQDDNKDDELENEKEEIEVRNTFLNFKLFVQISKEVLFFRKKIHFQNHYLNHHQYLQRKKIILVATNTPTLFAMLVSYSF